MILNTFYKNYMCGMYKYPLMLGVNLGSS